MSDTPRPKPAPPKSKLLGARPTYSTTDEVQEVDLEVLSRIEAVLDKPVVPDTEKIEVTQKETGMKTTISKEELKTVVKQPFVRTDQLMDRPLQNHPALLALKADLKPEEQREVKRVTKPFKRSFKKRSNSK